MDIQLDTAKHRFFVVAEDQDCVLEYKPIDEHTVEYFHTEVPVSLRGRGIAGELAHFALDYARQRGWHVVPTCSYVRGYIDTHPEYADLVA